MSSHEQVITIDGPSGTGKGTVGAWLAGQLQWLLLDSGAIYRAMAWYLLQNDVDDSDEELLVNTLKGADISVGSKIVEKKPVTWVCCNNQDISAEIRSESCSKMASKISAIKEVRDLVLDYQRSFCQPPGLVTDGRDMGTVVFPNARLKIFLTASTAVRSRRRYKQLLSRGVEADLDQVTAEMISRDERDSSRSIAPAVAAEDAVVIDTDELSLAAVKSKVYEQVILRGIATK